MARPEAQALAGFYATPPTLVPAIAALVSVDGADSARVAAIDPCAGEGDAVLGILDDLACRWESSGDAERSKHASFVAELYLCEMEASRHAKLVENVRRPYLSWQSAERCLRGDAFRIECSLGRSKGASLLYLNPPYDSDREFSRLEERFFRRFAPMLAPGGALLYVVPHYALAASAETIARSFSSVSCFRFPDEEFAAYKQVVLIAAKLGEDLLAPDAAVAARVRGWAEDASSIPVLGEAKAEPLCLSSECYSLGLDSWAMRTADLAALAAKARPWERTDRTRNFVPVSGIVPDVPAVDLLRRVYPSATPPRPAHLAAGIAAGIFNGARLEAEGCPPILIKGVFDREYETVEEKRDRKGDVKGVVQVQRPKLVVTALDLSTYRYHTLDASSPGKVAENAGDMQRGLFGDDPVPGCSALAKKKHRPALVKKPSFVEGMTIADLLDRYAESMAKAMERQCPVLYDPRTDAPGVPLVEPKRPLFAAQAHAARAIVRLLGGPKAKPRARRGKAAILLGEIGSGKSPIALASAITCGARTILIMCPPHLLTSWRNEVARAYPGAEYRVLSDVGDVDALANDRTGGEIPLIIAAVSREAGKLGHAWAAVSGTSCPRCSAPLPKGGDLAKKRACCEAKKRIAKDRVARLAVRLALLLQPHSPEDPTVAAILDGRFDQMRAAAYVERIKNGSDDLAPGRRAWTGFPVEQLDEVLGVLVAAREELKERAERAIVWALLAGGRVDRVRSAAWLFSWEGTHDYQRSFACDLMMLLPSGVVQEAAFAEAKAVPTESRGGYGMRDIWQSTRDRIAILADGKSIEHFRGAGMLSFVDGVPKVGGARFGSIDAALGLLAALAGLGKFALGKQCGELLYQAIPEPRRLPLAKYIAHRHSRLFDFLIVDESHEYGGDGTAQSHAAGRLMNLKLPSILMTGTVMNGYAESLFSNFWAASPAFREEFARDDRQRFVDRYGYRKRVLEDRKDGAVVEYGSMTDRVQRSERIVGDAPGVLPLFVLKHLLPIGVTLHKADLALDLPRCAHRREEVEPSEEQERNYLRLRNALVSAIKRDRFEPGLAGKLFGQLAELPSYLDRAAADVGNRDDGRFEIRYPESAGGGLVAAAAPISAKTLLPKERWLVDVLRQELAEGRRAMVFVWHLSLLPRLARIVERELNEPAPILYAAEVATSKRQDWIDREIVRKGRRILIANPVSVQTGLNNLVHFSTEVWFENPACNPTTYRQAIGRVDRIGQKVETRIISAVYARTIQVQAHELLLRKVAVAIAADGLDPEGALAAVGGCDDETLAGLSIGKQLWKMIGGDG